MNNVNLLLVAIILGAIEGLTEFLPVSSTGHMIIIGHLLWFEGETAKTFEIVIQLGSILAVIIIFWRQLFGLIGIHFDNQIFHKDNNQRYLTIIHIIFGITPSVVLGSIFYNSIKSLFNPINVMYALVVGSLLLIITEYVRRKKEPHITKLENITYYQAFIIGCFQCLAFWPGFSRSGATISGGMLVGINRYVASEFSFLLAIPTIICATILDLYKSIDFLTTSDILILSTGFSVAFIVALISIKTFLYLIKNISFVLFAIYRFVVAAAIYIISC